MEAEPKPAKRQKVEDAIEGLIGVTEAIAFILKELTGGEVSLYEEIIEEIEKASPLTNSKLRA